MNDDPIFSKKTLTLFEQKCEALYRKKGLIAQQIATMICSDNQYLLQELEVKALLDMWHKDREALRELRRKNRTKK